MIGVALPPIDAGSVVAGPSRSSGRPEPLNNSDPAYAVGRMIERMVRRRKQTAINLVRRPEHVDLLKKQGAEHVIDTSGEGWQATLKALTDRYHIRIALDAVGGELSGQLAEALSPGGRVIVYGALAGEACQISPSALIFENKRIEWFWLTQQIKERSFFQNLRMIRECQTLLGSELKTEIQGHFPLDQIQEALALYKQNRSAGKVLLVPAQ